MIAIQKAFIISLILFAVSGCCSKDEGSRVASPDNSIDAVLVESNCSATVSFIYKVYVMPHRASLWKAKEVAYFYDSIRNNGSAYGVNLHWLNESELSLEYFKSQQVELKKSSVKVSNKNIHIMLKPGVEDVSAPTGGMLWNLEKRKP